MSDSLDRFIKLLLRSGLITESQLSEIRSQLTPNDSSSFHKDLADKLADSGHLTAFQADELRQGHIEDLVVGDYIILEFLDKGGMGQIFKARHALMKREVAIKFTLPDADGTVSQIAIDRFQREVEAASKLTHPNIVTSLDAGQRGAICYLVMEFVRGTNLARHVRKNGPMAFHQALDCIIQASQGLEYSHRKGVVHRDIKPSNLLLTEDGQIKILDMGLVRVRPGADSRDSQKPSEQLTENGQLLGSLDFMAPEQAIDPHNVDKPADIYSLGCTLYYILTGTPPFRREGATQMSRVIAHREDPIPSLCSVRADVPKEFEPIFQKMMAKQQQKRYQSLSELIVDLRKIQMKVGLEDCALEETLTMPPETRSGGIRSKRLAIIVTVAIACVAGILLATRPWEPSNATSKSQSIASEVDSSLSQPQPMMLAPVTGLTDLLTGLDLPSAVIAGDGWKMSEGILQIPGDAPSKMCVPVLLPQKFQLTFQVKRTSLSGPFVIGIKDPERQCYLIIDGLRKNTVHVSAIGTGKTGRMVVTSEDKVLLNIDESEKFRLDVSEDGVSLNQGEEQVMHWEGDFSTMSLGAGWGVGDRSGILIGSNDGATFELQMLQIDPVLPADGPASNQETER